MATDNRTAPHVQVLERFAKAIPERDWATVASLFTPDGALQWNGAWFDGREAVVAVLQRRPVNRLRLHVRRIEDLGGGSALADGGLESDLEIPMRFTALVGQVGAVIRSIRFHLVDFNTEVHAEIDEEEGFDRAWGTDTSRSESLEETGLADRGGSSINYVASIARVVTQACRMLPLEEGRYTFVDLGCGKGRVLLAASHFPFAGIRGIELTPSLCEIARANIGKYREPGQRCTALEVVQGDILTSPFPSGDLVFYFYFALLPPALRVLAERLRALVEGSQRRIFFISVDPKLDLSEEFSFLRRYAVHEHPLPFQRFHIYTNG